jgi:hypothetical protein
MKRMRVNDPSARQRLPLGCNPGQKPEPTSSHSPLQKGVGRHRDARPRMRDNRAASAQLTVVGDRCSTITLNLRPRTRLPGTGRVCGRGWSPRWRTPGFEPETGGSQIPLSLPARAPANRCPGELLGKGSPLLFLTELRPPGCPALANQAGMQLSRNGEASFPRRRP